MKYLRQENDMRPDPKRWYENDDVYLAFVIVCLLLIQVFTGAPECL